ncbi:MAG: WYL domain-containing protein [Campylobacterota bacterium]|nr:WYL domain-containing protein [Campylobacterota bacterium]
MATNQTDRVLELLKRFNNGQKVCIESLQQDEMWYGKSERTIGRDFKVLKEYFPESFELIRGGKGEKGCYKAVTNKSFENFMKPEVLSLMVQTFNMASRSDMFDNFDLDADDKKIISKKIKEMDNIYEFKNKPFENAKSDSVIFKTLESRIKARKCIILEYPNMGELTKIEVKPYKILFINENFYLACEVEHEDYSFSMYRISKIKTIEDIPKTYNKNLEIENFIKDIQTPFPVYQPNYKEHLIDIKLEVAKPKAFFFKSKNYLKSQEIVETKEDGTLIVNYKVTQEYEIEELIKRWIPYVKVISPLSLKQKIENELKEYLE